MESANVVLILVVVLSLVVNIEKKMIIKELDRSLDLRDDKIALLRNDLNKRIEDQKDEIYRIKHYNSVLEYQLKKFSKKEKSRERKSQFNWI